MDEDGNSHSNNTKPLEMITPPFSPLVIRRQTYTQSEIDNVYADQSPSKTVCDVIRTKCRCSAKCVGTQALSYLPVVKSLRHYNWRQWTASDLVAGLSVGFIHLPQGLGFGLLAGLTPAVGLYTSFFPILVYLFFGTSPHISMGTNAVIAILTSDLVQREATVLQERQGENSTLTEDELMDYKIGVATAAGFVVGLILLGMGLLRLGFLTNFLAKSFIGGFTFAAAVHITTSQIVKMLHVRIKGRAGAGKLPLTYIDVFKNITTSNPADIIVGLICMAVLLAVKIGINERFKHKLKVPVPIELIVVILATIISHFAELRGKYGIAIVGHVPTGMPTPSLPDMEAVPRVAAEAFVIAILCFALSISLGKLCAKLHGTRMDDNQELVAYGLCSLVGSFFQNFPACTAPPRTMMLSSLGVKSTLNGVASAVFILLVLLVAGQLFVSLPIAMLAAMIIVAMKDLLMQIRQLPSLWRVNKCDFFIWLLTAIVSVFGDLDLGLLAGVVFSMVTVLAVSQVAKGRLLGTAESEDVVMDTRRKGIKTVPGVRIFRFDAQLYFASQERFKSQLYSLVFDPTKIVSKEGLVNVKEKRGDSVSSESDKLAPEATVLTSGNEDSASSVHHVILDCSALTYIDVAGIDTLKTVMLQYSRGGVEVYLAAVPTTTLATLHRAEFFKTCSTDAVFYTVFDALKMAKEAGPIVLTL